jgi:hypothetical protein
MKMTWIALACALLTAACSHRALRVECDGTLRPINAPAPVARASTPADALAGVRRTSQKEEKP